MVVSASLPEISTLKLIIIFGFSKSAFSAEATHVSILKRRKKGKSLINLNLKEVLFDINILVQNTEDQRIGSNDTSSLCSTLLCILILIQCILSHPPVS